MSSSLVSVVMCTYNGSRFVGEQIESICAQTHADLELIIVDDTSTDNTYEIAQSFAVKDARIRLFRNETNLGYNLNFDRACKLANGNFIAIADQDDVWEKTKIERLLTKLTEAQDILLVHCISARFEKFGEFHLKSPKLVNYDAGKDTRNFFLSNFISGHNMLLKRGILEKAFPFPHDVYYDWWLAVVASCNGRIEGVSEILVWHRVHDSNATGAAKLRMPLYKQELIVLPQLITIQEMKAADKKFAQKLISYYSTLPEKKFSFPLFNFLLSHSRVLFAHKKRGFPWLSYLKHSWKAAKASTWV